MVRGLGEGMKNIQSIADGWLVKLETDGIVNFCKFTNLLTLFRPMELPIKLHTIKSGWSIVYTEGSQVIISAAFHLGFKVRKTARIRNRYNQVPHLSQDTKWESNKITINITNKSQEVSHFPSGDHKAATNRLESMTSTRLHSL